MPPAQIHQRKQGKVSIQDILYIIACHCSQFQRPKTNFLQLILTIGIEIMKSSHYFLFSLGRSPFPFHVTFKLKDEYEYEERFAIAKFFFEETHFTSMKMDAKISTIGKLVSALLRWIIIAFPFTNM